MYNQSPVFIIVDLFCGAGGVTTGFAMADNGIARVIACVNHDPKAIESHWKNHPEVKHFEEDIRTLDLTELAMHAKDSQQMHPGAKLVLWASLECTNFSNAKGGQPRDADSRTLANHLHRYVDILKPDYVMIENVVEFRAWGPLDKKGKPIDRKKGKDFTEWNEKMISHGYINEWNILNSADFGAYTSRKRLFGIFARPELPITWPEPTHAKKVTGDTGLKKWQPVKHVLNFQDEGESIFTRKKALSDKTLERIFAGLIKYVAKGDTSFLSKYYSGKPSGKNISIDGPAGTVTCVDGQALVNAQFLLKYNSTDKSGQHYPPSINDPSPVLTTQDRLGLISPEFLIHYYGAGGQHSSVENPAPVIPTKARTALVDPEFFLDKHFGNHGNAQNQSVNDPAGVIMPNDKHRLVEVTPFLMPTSYDNKPKSVDEPAPTIQASRRHHYIVNPSHGGHCTSTDQPCPVIVARQDKAPLYVVIAENGPVAVEVYEGDSEAMIRIKQFMAVYGLVDIKMRMLRVIELLKIQGFPENYVLCGNQADRKKFIGNSVVPLVVKVWAEALAGQINIGEEFKVA